MQLFQVGPKLIKQVVGTRRKVVSLWKSADNIWDWLVETSCRSYLLTSWPRSYPLRGSDRQDKQQQKRPSFNSRNSFTISPANHWPPSFFAATWIQVNAKSYFNQKHLNLTTSALGFYRSIMLMNLAPFCSFNTANGSALSLAGTKEVCWEARREERQVVSQQAAVSLAWQPVGRLSSALNLVPPLDLH